MFGWLDFGLKDVSEEVYEKLKEFARKNGLDEKTAIVFFKEKGTIGTLDISCEDANTFDKIFNRALYLDYRYPV